MICCSQAGIFGCITPISSGNRTKQVGMAALKPKREFERPTQRPSILLTCVTLFALGVFLLVVLLILSRREPPQPVTPTVAVIVPTGGNTTPTRVPATSTARPTADTVLTTPETTFTPQPRSTGTTVPIKGPLAGKIVLVTRASVGSGRQIFALNGDGSAFQPLTYNDGGRTLLAYGFVTAVSPDGARVAYLEERLDTPLYLLDVTTGQRTAIPLSPYHPWRMVWSPDSSRLLVIAQAGGPTTGLFRVNVGDTAMTDLKIKGTVGLPSWSPDGSAIAFTVSRENQTSLVLTNPEGGDEKTLTTMSSIWWGPPGFSPDGKMLAFSNKIKNGSLYELHIFTISTDGSNLRMILNLPAPQGNIATTPMWSPDGSALLFVTQDPSDLYDKVYRVNPDGTGFRQLIPGAYHYASWSPDGKTILVEEPDGALSLVSADGTKKKAIGTHLLEEEPLWIGQ